MTDRAVMIIYCETCSEETPHRVLRGEIKPDPEAGFEGTVRCERCGMVHHTNIPSEKPVSLPMILSEGDRSRTERLELGPLEEIKVGEEIYFGNINIKITSIQSSGSRVAKAKGRDIDTLYAKVFTSLAVKVAIVRGSTTRSESLIVPPDEEFEVGDILEFGRAKVVVDKILTDSMVRREGILVEARDIKRIYAKPMRERSY